MTVINECQSRFIRTVATIEYFKDLETDSETGSLNVGNLIRRLHTILCLNHPWDNTAESMLDNLIDGVHIAWMIDGLMSGETLNPWDYKRDKK